MDAKPTDLIEVSLGEGPVVSEMVSAPPAPVVKVPEPEFKPLTTEEDTFALAVIEYGGNLRAAYIDTFGGGVKNPLAKARVLLARPEISARIQELTIAVADASLISLGSHMMELAEIRDLGKATGQLKTALEAEKMRGVAAGLYNGKGGAGSPGNNSGNPMVVVLQNNIDMRI